MIEKGGTTTRLAVPLGNDIASRLPRFRQAGFGWMGWVLREGHAISTRRARYDGNGIYGEGFHPFFTKEGKLRGGLEFLTEPPQLRVPWEKG